jgi:hypothetical protein
MKQLESMTDNMYNDLKEELNGISRNLEKLNGDFFKGIVREVMREELQISQRRQAEEVKGHFDASVQ